MSRLRTLPAVGLVLGLAGCHHEQAVYPPAPALAPTRTAPAEARRAPAVPASEPDELYGKPVSTEVGLASWYGPPYHNRKGADGTVFDENALTAAHRELPMGTMVRVTNLSTNQSVVARITDRGPFVPGRTLDLSKAAAQAIGLYRMGVAKVRVEAYAKPGADPEGRWCVQIGTFIDPEDAVQLKNDLARRYQTAKVIEFAGPTGHWVRINPAVPNHATAEKIADAIHLPDAEPYLIRLN
jgi:rare lipoprotein A